MRGKFIIIFDGEKHLLGGFNSGRDAVIMGAALTAAGSLVERRGFAQLGVLVDARVAVVIRGPLPPAVLVVGCIQK